MPKPSTTICKSGITREKKSVAGSRRTWRTSLKKTAPKPRKRLGTGGLEHGLMLVGEFDEDVFEAGSEGTNLGDGDAVFQELFTEIVEIEMVFDERMDGLPENGGAADAGEVAREAESAGNFWRDDFNSQGALRVEIITPEVKIGR